MRKRKWGKRLIIGSLLAIVVWLLGDFVYSRVVAYRVERWEAGIMRDESGVREGCQAFRMGEGERAILMVHGINDSPAAYTKLAPALAEQGFTCRVMRLPGFALPLEQYASKDRADWIAAVKAEVDLLAASHQDVTIVAHSLGAAVTLRYLLSADSPASRLVLLAPAVDVSNDRSPLLPTSAWHAVGNRLLLFTTVTESPFSLDAHQVSEEDYPWRTPFAPRCIFDETFALIRENAGCAAQLKTPLLMILARDDRVIDNRAAKEFFEAAGSVDKKLVVVENSGHAITIDADWEQVAGEIAAFIQ